MVAPLLYNAPLILGPNVREKEENKKDQYAEKKNLNWDPCTEDAQTKPPQLKSSHRDTKEI